MMPCLYICEPAQNTPLFIAGFRCPTLASAECGLYLLYVKLICMVHVLHFSVQGAVCVCETVCACVSALVPNQAHPPRSAQTNRLIFIAHHSSLAFCSHRKLFTNHHNPPRSIESTRRALNSVFPCSTLGPPPISCLPLNLPACVSKPCRQIHVYCTKNWGQQPSSYLQYLPHFETYTCRCNESGTLDGFPTLLYRPSRPLQGLEF